MSARDELAKVLGEHRLHRSFLAHGGPTAATCECGVILTPEYLSWAAEDLLFTQHLTDVVADVIRDREQEAARKALEAAARDWQHRGWTILTEPIPAAAMTSIARGQQVTDWLRARAERGGE